MTTITKTVQVRICGSLFTVAKVGDYSLTLIGKRGAEHILVQNVHSGRLFLISGARSQPVARIEIVRDDTAATVPSTAATIAGLLAA